MNRPQMNAENADEAHKELFTDKRGMVSGCTGWIANAALAP
jgi:hypothetical protein